MDGRLRVLGWREWAALPTWGLGSMLAKIDTGARTSALHVDWCEEALHGGAPWVRFGVVPNDGGTVVSCAAAVTDRRAVTDSGGRRSVRLFIHAELQLGDWRGQVEMNLASRHGLRHPLLVGRSALAGRWCVDPARRFVLGGPEAGT